MSKLSPYYSAGILNNIFNNLVFSMPTAYYFGFSLDGVEPVAADYARKVVVAPTYSGRVLTFNSLPSFPTIVNDWGNINNWDIYDALSGGNKIFSGDLTGTFAFSAGKDISIDAASISLTIPSVVSNIGMSDTLSNIILDFLTGASAISYADLYVGFGTNAFLATSTISGEATLGGYVRTAIGAASILGNTASNSLQIDFTTTGDWTASLDCIFVSNSASGTLASNLYFFSTMTAISPVAGKPVYIPGGGLELTL